MEENVSDQLIKQRVRNQFIYYFELMSSEEEILEYQRKAPIAYVAAEIFNHWDDFYRLDNLSYYSEPVFSKQEFLTLQEYSEVIEASSKEINIREYSLPDLLKTNSIQNMIIKARKCLKIMEIRGKMDE